MSLDGKQTPCNSDRNERLVFRFMQCHDLPGAEKRPMDKIDEELNSLCVQWQRKAGDADALTSSRVNGVV